MTKSQVRHKIAEILVKWDMPTRQAAISEILQLFSGERKVLEDVVFQIESIFSALCSVDEYTDSHAVKDLKKLLDKLRYENDIC